MAIQQWLHPFPLAPGGYVEAFRVPELPDVEIDPRYSSGRMRFTSTGVPVFAVHGLLSAGEPPEVVAYAFGLDVEQVRAVQRYEDAHPQRLSQVA
jgi:uncharacterized protein (DUF433 family)